MHCSSCIWLLENLFKLDQGVLTARVNFPRREVSIYYLPGKTQRSKVVGEMIYAGGRQVGESIELEVIKEVSQSYLTQLWNNDIFRKDKSYFGLGTYADKVGSYFIAVTLLIALNSLVYWVPRDLDMAIKAFTSVLQHSTRPLSQSLYGFLQGPLLPVQDYCEVPGQGLSGRVGGLLVEVGTAGFTSVPCQQGAAGNHPDAHQLAERDPVVRAGRARAGLAHGLNPHPNPYTFFVINIIFL